MIETVSNRNVLLGCYAPDCGVVSEFPSGLRLEIKKKVGLHESFESKAADTLLCVMRALLLKTQRFGKSLHYNSLILTSELLLMLQRKTLRGEIWVTADKTCISCEGFL